MSSWIRRGAGLPGMSACRSVGRWVGGWVAFGVLFVVFVLFSWMCESTNEPRPPLNHVTSHHVR